MKTERGPDDASLAMSLHSFFELETFEEKSKCWR